MKTGVLLMAHGTPASLAEMPEYLRIVRGGRPPSPELIEEMTHNYRAIGGSPLTDLTLPQPDPLARRAGTRGIGLPRAPQVSTWRGQKYRDAAKAALRPGMTLEPVRSFHAHPL